jgi:ferredoxin
MKLIVDMTRCAGHGVCAELLPGTIELDEWGYPIVTAAVPAADEQWARSAVSTCPALALHVASEVSR